MKKNSWPKLIYGSGNRSTKKSFSAYRKSKQGITFLIAMMLLSAILSISLGVFGVIYAQFVLTGEITDSFLAFYAADQGMERYLYLDRNVAPVCTPVASCSVSASSPPLASGSCYYATITKNLGNTKMQIVGRYACVLGRRLVYRALEVNY